MGISEILENEKIKSVNKMTDVGKLITDDLEHLIWWTDVWYDMDSYLNSKVDHRLSDEVWCGLALNDVEDSVRRTIDHVMEQVDNSLKLEKFINEK